MARFKAAGIDSLIKEMKSLGETTGEVADKMLVAGAKEVKKAWEKAADIHNLKLTGQMKDSIGFPKTPTTINGIKTMDIYPQGKSTYTVAPNGKRYKRRKPVRNAEVAFVLHYGSSKIKATHWVDTADELAEVPVFEAMNAIWDEELRKRGL